MMRMMNNKANVKIFSIVIAAIFIVGIGALAYKEARAKFAAGELSREQLTEVEDQEIAKSVQDKAMEAAKAVGDAKGLSVVMTKDTVLYGGVDITDQVLKKLATDAKK